MILQLDNAAFGYGKTPVVNGIDLHLDGGQGLALIGANGSGKTTLLRGILGLMAPLKGSVTVNTKRISYVPQVADLDRSFPVVAYDVVAMGVLADLKFFQPVRRYRSRIMAALGSVGLQDKANTRFGSLSGGQQQRVLLARAIVSRPDLVLLDEPFNGLDGTNRTLLQNLLLELKASNTAFVASTHDMDLATETCDNTLIVSDDPVCGPTAQMVAQYVG